MAEAITLARPYAKALFALADSQDALAAWTVRLGRYVAIVETPEIKALIGHPRVDQPALARLIAEVGAAGGDAVEAGEALLGILAKNGRLPLLGEIARQYREQVAAAENRIEAEVTTVVPLSAALRDKLLSALTRRFGKAVTLHEKQDPALIGGLVVRAGDTVIDASLKGRLHQLAGAMRGG